MVKIKDGSMWIYDFTTHESSRSKIVKLVIVLDLLLL